ncbi:MAG: hypothetical protein GXX96_39730 [Planctomycetaceae bacterium]|nr:hypothetical protein [Planctomycetaceae bacterium]
MPTQGSAEYDGLQGELEQLRTRVLSRRRRGRQLGFGALAALLMTGVCLGGYWAATVWPFAALEGLPTIERGLADPDRLAFAFTPVSRGKVAFRRVATGRDSELLDQVLRADVRTAQAFEWQAEGVRTGDSIQITYRDGFRLRRAQVVVPEPQRLVTEGEASLRGQIVNAVNNQPIAGAVIRMVGNDRKAEADAEGWFFLEKLPEGNVPLEVSAEGFTIERFERTLDAALPEAVRVVLSPGLEVGQLRLVLTWNKEPADLDAHLEGPLPDGERFHIYFHQPGNLRSREFVNLDVDDRDGEGPETITVLGVLPGEYRYYVHDYTNLNNPEADALSRSGSEVKVYHGGQTYRFTPESVQPGNVWNVCTIEVAPSGAVVEKIGTIDRVRASSLGLYAKRTQGNRGQWIGQYGGTPESEAAVADGLAWLARHQMPGGHWGPDCLGSGAQARCEAGASCTGPGGSYEAAQTGLALLAFQAGGHYYFNGNTYSDSVRRGLDWLVARQRPDGALVGSHPARGNRRLHQYFMYEHGIAAFALGEACAVARASGQTPDPRYLGALRRAMRFIEEMQHNDGGWRYQVDPKPPSDTSVTGWQVLAIKTAQEAAVPVNDFCLSRIGPFFDAHAVEATGQTRYMGGNTSSEATTGVGMLARQFLLDEADSPMVSKAAEFLADLAEKRWDTEPKQRSDRDYYLWYNCTLAMFHAGGEPWQRWNSIIRDAIVNLQRDDGCSRGSWDPESRWGDKGGRVYSTALATLCLEVYYRYARGNDTEPGPVVTTIEVPDAGPELTEREKKE